MVMQGPAGFFIDDVDDDKRERGIFEIPFVAPHPSASSGVGRAQGEIHVASPTGDRQVLGTAPGSVPQAVSPGEAAPPAPVTAMLSQAALTDGHKGRAAKTASGEPSGAASGQPTQKPHRRGAREEQLIGALKDLMRNDADIQAAALVSMDGFMMASALPAGMQADRVAAMSAAILGLGERVAAELGRGGLSEVFVEGEEGYVLMMAAGTHAVLTGLAGKTAKLGLVLYNMRDAAATVGRVLS